MARALPEFGSSAPYHVTRDDLPEYDGPIWQAASPLPPYSEKEADSVRRRTVRALNEFGEASEIADNDLNFYVFDKGFDRTVYVEVTDAALWNEVAVDVVRRLQACLRDSAPDWRILIPGDSHEDEAIVTYPDGLVFSPELASFEDDEAKIRETARRRMSRSPS